MTFNRRRFLSLVSASCLFGGAAAAGARRWQGIALGAKVQIILDHPDAASIIAAAQAEIRRLESIFSLYQPDSEIMRLNRVGHLDAPSFELLDCLGLARHLHRSTDGRFDPSVQPLWQLLAEAAAAGHAVSDSAMVEVRNRIGFDRVALDSHRITLGQRQALTLNGIAQGYIADRVAGLMAARGVRDVLIDTGEIVAMGQRAGQPKGWPVTLAATDEQRVLQNRALASSASFGTRIGLDGGVGHILSPDGQIAPALAVSVSADTAALADGLSTALCLAPDRATAETLVSQHPGARLEVFEHTA